MSMPQLEPSFFSALRLGRIIEELASINRKQVATDTLKAANPNVETEAITSLTQKEIELSNECLTSQSQTILPYLPLRLVEILQKIDDSDPTGFGSMDPTQLSILHAAISGLIEETMEQRTIWNCLQLGRLVQRSWLIISNIRDTLEGRTSMPKTFLLSYIAMRTDNPVPEFDQGTHLWNVHRVFYNMLKSKGSPKSLATTLDRIGKHALKLPVPEALKKDHENVMMTINRISNDLSFIDVHEMIGDDPETHFAEISEFFDRHQYESEKLVSLLRGYTQSLGAYLDELSEDEVFEVDY